MAKFQQISSITAMRFPLDVKDFEQKLNALGHEFERIMAFEGPPYTVRLPC